MDAIDKRRTDHINRLRDNHEKDFDSRFTREKTREEKRNASVSDAISADWNRKQKAKRQKAAEREKAEAEKAALEGQRDPLPEGWRDLHWKKLQSLASEVAGVEAGDKEASIAALEAYEASLNSGDNE